MANKPVRIFQLRSLLRYHKQEVSKSEIGRLTGMARNTVKQYIQRFEALGITYNEIVTLSDQELKTFFFRHQPIQRNQRFEQLQSLFPQIVQQMNTKNVTLLHLWKQYCDSNRPAYQYTQFHHLYSNWCKLNHVTTRQNKWQIPSIEEDDLKVLKCWKHSSDRRKWERGVVLLEAFRKTPCVIISQLVGRTLEIVKEWIEAYQKNGLKGLEKQPRKANQAIVENIQTKKANLIKLIHETPQLHGINRTSWSLKTLSETYYKVHGICISVTSISEYIDAEGYSFRKARETLTSPDPHFREKLENITSILSQLGVKEKFFSVDEFGPFAVKIKGGRSLQKKGETKTFPQLQKSKGCLICTAALELSTNQITHFYSDKKNTDEMIKLLEKLLLQYKGEEKIYFSWDAASWHASKKLYKKIESVNEAGYRQQNQTAIVELAPLPSSAQFLNVIESVFSGLAKAVIHNSNYGSVQECKEAIDLYFKERNEHFLTNPKRAGKKIWGKEIQEPFFNTAKNFKDPKWR